MLKRLTNSPACWNSSRTRLPLVSNWGSAWAAQGKLAEAAEAFARVLRLHPEDAGDITTWATCWPSKGSMRKPCGNSRRRCGSSRIMPAP